MTMRNLGRVTCTLLLALLVGCSSLPSLSYTPVDAQVGKENINNTVASQSNTAGDSSALTLNSSTSMIASFFAGGVLCLLSSLGPIYLLIKKEKNNGQTVQAKSNQSLS